MSQFSVPGMDVTQQSYTYPTQPISQVQPQPSTQVIKGLYVGNLDSKVNDALLWEVFNTIGHVESCKIIKDKFGESAGYGFVEYFTREDAERALQTLNGKTIYNKEIKVNWASHSNNKEDTSNVTNLYNIFVGDLSSEIDDETLKKAFEAFGSIAGGHVMWDQNTGRSRGYGFVSFRDKADAERAMSEMNGVWLGNRAIRCNWANQKMPGATTSGNTNFDDVSQQATSTNCTVYVGNLPADLPESVLAASFQNYGTIEEIRVQKGKGYGFVRYQSHEQATRAIVAGNETTIQGRPIKCSWGKERPGNTNTTAVAQAAQLYGYYAQYPQNYMVPQYYGQQYYPQTEYYTQGYDPYAAYAGYYQQPPSSE